MCARYTRTFEILAVCYRVFRQPYVICKVAFFTLRCLTTYVYKFTTMCRPLNSHMQISPQASHTHTDNG